MKVSVRKISEITGFSPATVSNALNYKKGVNAETSAKIFKVAQDLGYFEENHIRKIKFVMFKRDGAVVEDSPFFIQLISGVEQECRACGMEMQMCNLDKRDPGYQEQAKWIMNDKASAVILLGTEMVDADIDLIRGMTKVELCGVNTAELPILSEQEKRDLLTRARAGDKKARQSMIEGNLRLVLSVVQRFSQRGENMDDLFQVGCIGLIKAIDNFDPAQQVRFSTYGVPMIIGEIRRFLRDNNALRVSRSLRDTAYRAMQSREELEKQLGREPTVDEIAQKTGLSRREVSAALESVVEPLSLEEPVYADGGDAVYVIDQVRDPDGEDSWISGLQFRQTVAGLTPREKRIMELRYLKGKTQMEVAREIGISQAQVSRLEKAALEQFHQMT